MKRDIPLIDFFECPSCGYRGQLNAEPAIYVKCICGRWWVIGDYKYFDSLTREERKKIRRWDLILYKGHEKMNCGQFDSMAVYS